MTFKLVVQNGVFTRKIFDEKLKGGEIIFYESGVVSFDGLLFPNTRIEANTR